MEAIFAISKNHVIGKGNKLPWFLKEDLQHFKTKTLGRTIIAGSTTVSGLPKLKDRFLVQLSSKFKYENANEVCYNADTAFIKHPSAIVIGGTQTIFSLLPAISKLTITYIDIFIPEDEHTIKFPLQKLFDSAKWIETDSYDLSNIAKVREYIRVSS